MPCRDMLEASRFLNYAASFWKGRLDSKLGISFDVEFEDLLRLRVEGVSFLFTI